MLNLLPMKRKTVKGKRVLFEKEAIRKKNQLRCKEKVCNALCMLCPVSTSMVVRRENMCMTSGVYAQVVEKNLGLCENSANLKKLLSVFVADRLWQNTRYSRGLAAVWSDRT